MVKQVLVTAVLYVILLSKSLFAEEYYNFKLPNGLAFYIIKNNSPIVTYSTWYKVGGIDDPSSQEGMAHFVEHMMFKGTNRFSVQDFTTLMQKTGGTYNAFTNQDFTAYYITIAEPYLYSIMELEADRMQWLVFDNDDFDREKKVILEERSMIVDNNPLSSFMEIIATYIFPNSNYGRSLIGYKENILNIDLQSAKKFYKRYYVPNNAAVFIIGDVDVGEIKDYAHRYYGYLRKPIIEEPRLMNNEQEVISEVVVRVKDKRIKQKLFLQSYLAPSILTDNSHKKINTAALVLLEELLSGKSSYLYEELVLKKKIITNIGVSYNVNSRLNTSFNIILVPNDKISLNTLQQELTLAINKILHKGFTIKAIRLAARKIRDNITFLHDDNFSYLMFFANNIMSGLSVEETRKLGSNLFFVDTDEVNFYIKQLLTKQPLRAYLQKE